MSREKRFVNRAIPRSLGCPCFDCEKRNELSSICGDDYDELSIIQQVCMEGCEHIDNYERYHINSKVEPSIEEADMLLEMIGEILEKNTQGKTLSASDLDRLKVWDRRLSLVINLEEARITAMSSTFNSVEQILKEGGAHR